MAENFKITNEMKAQIGWESAPWTYEVTTSSVRAFARGVGYTDPVYYDMDVAKKAGYPDLPAPPTYLGTAVFIPGKVHDNLSFPLDLMADIEHGLQMIIDAGTEIEYFETVCAGDVLTVTCRLAGLETKQSKSVGTMLIMTSETIVRNLQDNVVAIERAQTFFF